MRRMRTVVETCFDLRSMGINAFVPAVTALLALLIVCFLRMRYGSISPDTYGAISQYVLVTMAAWLPIQAVALLCAAPGGEIYRALPVSRWALGALRVLRVCTINLLINAIYICLSAHIVDYSSGEMFRLYLQWSAGGLCVAMLGFLAISFMHNLDFANLAVMAYALFCIGMQNKILPFVSAYDFNFVPLPWKELCMYCIRMLGLAVGLMLCAQLVFTKLPFGKANYL